MIMKPPLADEILKNAETLPDVEMDLDNLKGHAGCPLAPDSQHADLSCLLDAMKQLEDPEIPVNFVDLGLIYGIERKPNGDVFITMSLTSPTCPTANEMPQMVADAVAAVDGVGVVDVDVVWFPAWDLSMMSDEARFDLDLF